MDESIEMLVESLLIDDSDPSRLSKSEIIESWGSLSNFMLSYGLKPYKFEDIEDAVSLSRSLKENDEDYDDDDDDDDDVVSLTIKDYEDEDDEDDDDEDDDDDDDDDGGHDNLRRIGLLQGDQDDETISAGLKINIAHTGADDELVDAHQPGTIVTLDIGRRENPVGRICKFNYGVGIFANPAYNPTEEEFQNQLRMDYENRINRKIDDDDDDDRCFGQCSYTIRYESGKFSNVACTEIHEDWDVISPLSSNVEQTDLSDLTILIPAHRRTLIITGLLFDSIEHCHYTQGLKEIYTSNNSDLDIILYDYTEMKSKMLSGEYSAVTLLSFGSTGPGGDCKQIMKNEMLSVIASYVKSGGTFIVQGEGIVTTLFNKCFQKKWSMASYGRADIELNLLPTLSSELLETFPKTYSAKAVSLSSVEDSCNLYSDESDQCSIAVSKYQLGKFVFIGDVNAESKTLQVIHGLANS